MTDTKRLDRLEEMMTTGEEDKCSFITTEFYKGFLILDASFTSDPEGPATEHKTIREAIDAAWEEYQKGKE
jgi:hypothetical protein